MSDNQVSEQGPREGQDPVDWAVETYRIPKSRSAHWRAELTAGRASVGSLRQLASVPEASASSPTHRSRPFNVAATTTQRPGTARSRNPIVEAAQAADPAAVAAATRRAAAPTLFAAGDLPPFTASGIDPTVLLQVPWQARHAVAAATSASEAYQLVQQYSGPDGQLEAEVYLSSDPGNQVYTDRVQQWLVNGLSEDELYASVYGDTPNGADRPAQGT